VNTSQTPDATGCK